MLYFTCTSIIIIFYYYTYLVSRSELSTSCTHTRTCLSHLSTNLGIYNYMHACMHAYIYTCNNIYIIIMIMHDQCILYIIS